MFKLPNWLYDVAKFGVTILIPAISSLYSGLAKIYGWPYAGEVAQTASLICTFIGSIIGISSYYYWQGQDEGQEESVPMAEDDEGTEV